MKSRTVRQKGAAMIIVVLFFVILATSLLIGISAPVSNQIKGTNEFLTSKSSYIVADSQAENALYRFNKGKTDAPSDISILGATATAVLTDIGDTKSLVVEGSKSIFDRYIKAIFKTDTGISFNYGLQVGNGGLLMSGSSHIIGNVYANGDIIGDGSQWSQQSYITGSAVAATLMNPTMDVSVSSSTAGSAVFPIGQTNTNQDVAQSFIAGTSTSITEVLFYIKKTGLPANITFKIVNDSSGAPGNTVITSGVLNASTVTTSFAYVPVVMSTAINLSQGNTYWIVLDTSSNDTSDYYSLRTLDGVYTTGSIKQGRFGNSMSNLGTTTLDFEFSSWVGGDAGTISGVRVGTSGSGDAWAHTVSNTTVTGSLYCASGSGNNKACDTSKSDPVSVAYPVSQANIDDWEDQATAGGSTSSVSIAGNSSRTLGPIKINGDLYVGSSGKLYVTGPIYVTGDIKFEGNARIYVDSVLGAASVNIVSDGTVEIGGSASISGSGQSGSYLVLTSNKSCGSTSTCLSNPTVKVEGSAGAVVLNALDGSVKLSGSAGVRAVVAKMMIMEGSTTLTYETGLQDISFTSGPSGSWIKKSWKEVLGW